MGKGTIDVEAGQGSKVLYPDMTESPEFRWGFIRKVYTIVSIQLLITALVASVFIFFPPARDWVQTNSLLRMVVLVCSALVSLIIVLVLSTCYKKHPVNLILLGLYTLCISVAVGFACAIFKSKIVLEAAILTGAVVLALTIYTFWAVKRGHDFSFLGPFLCAASLVLFLFGIIQIFCPFGPIGIMIYALLGALLMCGFIVYDTDDIIKRYSYDEYIWASIAIFADIINLFIYLLSILGILDS